MYREHLPGRITKIMPTQIEEVGEGVTLVCHNQKALDKDKEFLRSAFEKIGLVKEIEEHQFDSGQSLLPAPRLFTPLSAEISPRWPNVTAIFLSTN